MVVFVFARGCLIREEAGAEFELENARRRDRLQRLGDLEWIDYSEPEHVNDGMVENDDSNAADACAMALSTEVSPACPGLVPSQAELNSVSLGPPVSRPAGSFKATAFAAPSTTPPSRALTRPFLRLRPFRSPSSTLPTPSRSAPPAASTTTTRSLPRAPPRPSLSASTPPSCPSAPTPASPASCAIFWWARLSTLVTEATRKRQPGRDSS